MNHHLFFNWVSDESVIALKLWFDSLRAIWVRLDKASSLGWHVFDSFELILKESDQISFVRLVHSLESLMQVGFRTDTLVFIGAVPEMLDQV